MPLYKDTSIAWMYANMVPKLKEIAKMHGYALLLHGSMARDLDLVAVPWVEDCEEPEVLAEAIRDAIGGVVPKTHGMDKPFFHPSKRPHGRLSWAWYFDRLQAKREEGPYLDLSVMPVAYKNKENSNV